MYDWINGSTNKQTTDLKQEYVRVQNLKIDDVAANEEQKNNFAANEMTEGDNTYVDVTFGANAVNLVTGHKVEFDIVTKLTDADYYESNTGAGKRAFNTAVMYQGQQQLSSVDATCKPENEVLSKTAGNYNYSTRRADWTVVVNKDGMALTNARVSDELLTGDLVENSVKLGNTPLNKLQGTMSAPYYTYDQATNKLVVTLGNINTTQTITYQTEIKDDTDINKEGHTISDYSGAITLKNTATLLKDSSDSVPTATATKDITNKLAKKSVGDSGMRNTALYTILLNHSQIEWDDDTVMTDIMSSGLELNLASVKLYEVSIDTDGGYSSLGALVDKSKYTRTVTILGAGNSDGVEAGSTKFQFTLPENCGTQAYVMTYEASLDEESPKTTFSNILVGNGVSSQTDYTNVEVSKVTLEGYGGGVAVSQSRIRIYKYNSNGTVPLAGAIFGLYYDNQLIAQKTSNSRGYCTFGNLVPGEPYTIREIAAPEGFILDDTPQNFIAKAKGDVEFVTTNPFEARDERESFHITKTDENGAVLGGAKFGLFSETETAFTEANAIEIRTSGVNGNAEFATDDEGTYQIVELEAPRSYIKTDKILMVEIAATGAVSAIYEKGDTTKTQDITFVNQSIGAFTFQKTDQNGTALSGASFGLYTNNANVASASLIASATSTATGVVRFANLTPGTYQIAEIAAPEGYQKTDTVYEMSVSENGAISSMYVKEDATKTPVTTVVNTKSDEAVTPPGTNDTPTNTDKDKKPNKKPNKKPSTTDPNAQAAGAGAGAVSVLPKTGRETRMIYIVIGMMLILAGGVLYFLKGRRKHERQS